MKPDLAATLLVDMLAAVGIGVGGGFLLGCLVMLLIMA